MNFATASEDEVRAFLRLCLNPRPGSTRTPEALAEILPGPLLKNLHGYAPHLAELRATAEAAKAEAFRAVDAYADALGRWIHNEPEPPALCTQNGKGDDAVPQPHTFPLVAGEPSRCLWCGVPAEGSVPGYRTPDGREWTLAGEHTEDGLPLYEAPLVGTQYTASALVALYGTAEPLSAVQPPRYVFNARSVNRRPGTAVKHLPTPDGTATICPRAFQATKPMPDEEAARLPLCGGCRDAAIAAAGDVPPVWLAASVDGHEHWAWACRKETGGCGYESPFLSPAEAGAQEAYDGHRDGCRARKSPQPA